MGIDDDDDVDDDDDYYDDHGVVMVIWVIASAMTVSIKQQQECGKHITASSVCSAGSWPPLRLRAFVTSVQECIMKPSISPVFHDAATARVAKAACA